MGLSGGKSKLVLFGFAAGRWNCGRRTTFSVALRVMMQFPVIARSGSCPACEGVREIGQIRVAEAVSDFVYVIGAVREEAGSLFVADAIQKFAKTRSLGLKASLYSPPVGSGHVRHLVE